MSLDVAIRHRLGAMQLDVVFTAPPGVTALFGRSGAGKTTVVNAIAGLVTPDQGRIVLDGRVLFDRDTATHVPVHRRRVGYVFQEARLFPHLSVRGNLAFGQIFSRGVGGGRGGGRRARSDDMARIVELLGIEPLLDRRPGRLSGGEKARVAIGRALLARPQVLLMDEPLAALDAARKAEILPWIERLRDEARLPIVYVSHALDEIARLATTIVALDNGRVARSGPTGEVLADPDSFPLMGRQEAGGILAATLERQDDGDGLSRLKVAAGTLFVPRVDAPDGASLRLRIRARDVMLAARPPEGVSALNVLPVTVVRLAQDTGPMAEIGLDAGGERLLARITRRSVNALSLAPGSRCYAVVKAIAVGRRDIARPKSGTGED
ncbi:MAG: molybdenum ABC transporter ATP-binding protein [Pseudomonadota bacterium]